MFYNSFRVLGISSIAFVLSTCPANAQTYRSPFSHGAGVGGHGHGSQFIPHTSTHYHYIPHGNHIDIVPHTTTHYDRVGGFRTYGYGNIGGHGYRSSFYSSPNFGPNWNRPNFPQHSLHGYGRYWGNGHCHPF